MVSVLSALIDNEDMFFAPFGAKMVRDGRRAE
jgi:hypothetical protein